jgi:lipopolysaccharide export system permease protein
MNLLDRYIVRNFLMGMFPVALLLLVLFSFMALAEQLEDVGQGLFTQFDAFMVVLYTAPRRIVDLLPVTTLVGGLLGLGVMANHQELMAARVSGMSQPRMARPILILTVGLSLLVLLMQSFLIPYSERAANRLRAHALVETDVHTGGNVEFWTRSGNNYVRVDNVVLGRLPSNIEIYTTDARGRFKRLIEARSAVITGEDYWQLRDIVMTTIDGLVVHEEHRDELTWPGLLSSDQASILVLPLEALAPLDLSRLIRFQRENGLDTHRYRVVWWQEISITLAVIGMGLLTLPLLMGSTRAISAGQRVVLGGLVGIGFYLLQQIAGHLTGLFQLNPPSAIMAPAVVLLMAAVYAQFIDDRRKRRARRRAKGESATAFRPPV